MSNLRFMCIDRFGRICAVTDGCISIDEAKKIFEEIDWKELHVAPAGTMQFELVELRG